MTTSTSSLPDLQMKGRIHSVETFGTVDGPGIRFVLFLQGCALRCQFCHNPDSWDTTTGKVMTVAEVIEEIRPYIHYYNRSNGGVTVSGGEPTLQAAFVAALFRELKRQFNLHTTLDSSGFCDPHHVEETGLFDATDLVMLDLKMINEQKHHDLTTQSNKKILELARYLANRKQHLWIRHVVIPSVTDHIDDLTELGQFINQLETVTKLELLPYHTMGKYKWEKLGLEYTLTDIEPPTGDQMNRAERIVNAQIKSKELVINTGI